MNPVLLTAVTAVLIIIIIHIYYIKGLKKGRSEGWDNATLEIREFLGDDYERG